MKSPRDAPIFRPLESEQLDYEGDLLHADYSASLAGDYFNMRKLSIYVTWFLAKTPITPNQTTWLMILTGCCGAVSSGPGMNRLADLTRLG